MSAWKGTPDFLAYRDEIVAMTLQLWGVPIRWPDQGNEW